MLVLCEKGGLILILLQWRVIFTENIVKTLQFCCKEIDAKPLQKDQLFSSYAYSHSKRLLHITSVGHLMVQEQSYVTSTFFLDRLEMSFFIYEIFSMVFILICSLVSFTFEIMFY